MKQKKSKHKKKQPQTVSKEVQKTSTATEVVVKTVQEKDYKYALPIAEIKKDLLKTAAYAVFALGVILALNYFMPDTGLKFDLSRYKFF